MDYWLIIHIFMNYRNLVRAMLVNLFILGIFVVPFLVNAQTSPAGGANPPSGSGCSDSALICNPLQGGADTIPEVVNLILKKIVLPIGAVIIVFMIIYSGFLFVMAQGNEEKLKTAKKTFTYTIIGAAVLLGALVISELVQSTIDAIKASL